MQETEYMVSVSKKVIIQASFYTSKEITDLSLICVITHPYSLWGGSMNNNVVVGVRNQLVKSGLPCITFNFRGVGKSTGAMGDGTKEQNDLIAICDFAQKTLQYMEIFIVGYSYGGLIALSTAEKLSNIRGMSLISYPVGFVKHLAPRFSLEFPIHFIHGMSDDIIPIQRVEEILPKFKTKPTMESVPTDHFYNGEEKRIGIAIRDYINKIRD